MGAIRPTGRYQVACEISPGLRDAMLAQTTREGLNMSSLLRRALMHELGVDANGRAIRDGGAK